MLKPQNSKSEVYTNLTEKYICENIIRALDDRTEIKELKVNERRIQLELRWYTRKEWKELRIKNIVSERRFLFCKERRTKKMKRYYRNSKEGNKEKWLFFFKLRTKKAEMKKK